MSAEVEVTREVEGYKGGDNIVGVEAEEDDRHVHGSQVNT